MMKRISFRDLLWWLCVVCTVVLGILGFIFDENSWSKWLYMSGGFFAFTGHMIWLSGKR